MARTMYDSTNPYDIPANAPMVAGYVDGLYAWSQSGWDRHKGSVQVRICISPGTYYANVIDVENGDATADEAANWVAWQRSGGRFPSVYFSRSLFGTVSAAMQRRGLSSSDWGVWAADWTGQSHILAGTYATQYADSAMVGHHYDLSEVADYWPGVDATPPPPPSAGVGGAQTAWSYVQDLFNSVIPDANAGLAGARGLIENLV